MGFTVDNTTTVHYISTLLDNKDPSINRGILLLKLNYRLETVLLRSPPQSPVTKEIPILPSFITNPTRNSCPIRLSE